MNLSVIVIGKNCAATLRQTLESILAAIEHASEVVDGFEILYVDATSSDDSVAIAEEFFPVKTIVIQESTFYSAALGRNLGMRHARHDDLLFLDSDMTLDLNWFRDSLAAYTRCRAIVGRWTEQAYSSEGKPRRAIPNFNRIKTEHAIRLPCGFLQINRNVLPAKARFHPLVINNEEKDFYAQFWRQQSIYAIPVDAFTHHNFKQKTEAKLAEYTGRNTKTGYVVSLIYAVTNGYTRAYAHVHRDKVFNTIAIILTLIALASQVWWLLAVACALILFPLRKLKSRVADILFMPLKVLQGVRLYCRAHHADYLYDGRAYRTDLR